MAQEFSKRELFMLGSSLTMLIMDFMALISEQLYVNAQDKESIERDIMECEELLEKVAKYQYE